MPTIKAPELTQLVEGIFRAYGVEEEAARIVAESLVLSNLKGHDSHGVIRVPDYVDAVERGRIDPSAEPTIVRETDSLLLVDGGWGFGQTVGRTATAWAIAKAKHSGICALTIRRCGHLGRIGEWAEMAAEAGLVGLFFSSGAGGGVLMAPHGGRERRLSANPIAGGAPLPGGGMMVMDFATSAVAEGKLRVARRKGEAVAPGLVIDGRGEPSTDPAAFYGDPPGAILPFGGHKGFALAMFTDVLAGALTGAGCSRAGAGWRGNAMLAILLDPAAFCEEGFFDQEVGNLVRHVKSCPPAREAEEVLIPGEPEERKEAARSRGGIPIDPETWAQLASLATARNIPVPE